MAEPEHAGQRRIAAADPVADLYACLDRIAAVNGVLNAVLTLDPTALDAARASSRRLRAGRARSPLDGVPVLVKDNIDTTTMATTAGSRLLTGIPRPHRDAAIVVRLRRAGAVVVGKANLSEWSNIRSSRSTSGWSGVGGQTRNPHVLDRDPSGSSSGSAAAVAAGLVRAAIGTETDGSILSPAAHCGVVGFKPSLGLLSRTGIVPITSSQDTAGPLSRTVADAARLLLACAGPDRADPATMTRAAARARRELADLLAGGTLEPPDTEPDSMRDARGGVRGEFSGDGGRPRSGGRGQRLGVWRVSGPGGSRGSRAAVVFDAVLDRLDDAGFDLVEITSPSAELTTGSWAAMLPELRRDLDSYLQARCGADGAGPASLAEVIRANRADPLELSRFGQDLFEAALTGPAADSPAARGHRDRARGAANDWIRSWKAAGCVAVVASGGPAAATLRYDREPGSQPNGQSGSDSPARHVRGNDTPGRDLSGANGPESAGAPDEQADEQAGTGPSTPAAVAGSPSASIPVGWDGPLPLGMTVLGLPFQDAALLSLVARLHATVGIEATPRLLPTLPDPA